MVRAHRELGTAGQSPPDACHSKTCQTSINALRRRCVHSVEETQAAETRRLGAELVMMGAYGHSRLREFVTGGVTRYFLTAGEPALFLAH